MGPAAGDSADQPPLGDASEGRALDVAQAEILARRRDGGPHDEQQRGPAERGRDGMRQRRGNEGHGRSRLCPFLGRESSLASQSRLGGQLVPG